MLGIWLATAPTAREAPAGVMMARWVLNPLGALAEPAMPSTASMSNSCRSSEVPVPPLPVSKPVLGRSTDPALEPEREALQATPSRGNVDLLVVLRLGEFATTGSTTALLRVPRAVPLRGLVNGVEAEAAIATVAVTRTGIVTVAIAAATTVMEATLTMAAATHTVEGILTAELLRHRELLLPGSNKPRRRRRRLTLVDMQATEGTALRPEWLLLPLACHHRPLERLPALLVA